MPAKTCVVAVALAMVLHASPAAAQPDHFVQAVAQLAQAGSQPQAVRPDALRAAADRMAQALAEWDRLIATQEGLAAGDRDSSPADSYRRHIERGVMYRMRGRFADALRELDAATAARPDASDAQLLKALVLEAMDRAEDAGRAFATAWTLDDRNLIKTYYMLTRPAAGTKADRERALNLLAEAYRRDALEVTRPASPPSITFALTLDAIPDGLSRTPIVGDSTTAEAFALVAQAKFAEAIAALRRPRSAASPEDADAPLLHFVSGQQAERLGEVGSARHHYEQALAGALLGRSALYVAIARLAQVEGNTTAAVDGLRSAVRLTPNDSYVHKELAAAYVAQGRVDDALCELIAALLIDPRDAHAHATIGQLFLDTDRHSDAVHAFTKALELRPDAFEVRYGLATALARLGNADDATRQFDLFERARRAAQERRRRDIASDVDPRDALAPRPSGQDGQR